MEALADDFPPFDDRRILPGGKEVLFLKKTQIAVAELYQRRADSHWQFTYGDIESFTVACDNVLPCVLGSLGILEIGLELERKMEARESIPVGTEEAQLRVAAVFWSKELNDYLCPLVRNQQLRQIERHATIGTCFSGDSAGSPTSG